MAGLMLSSLWTTPVLAILVLLFVKYWKKLGLESEWGTRLVSVGAAWLLFKSSFEVMNTVTGVVSLKAIGAYVGGTLAWIFIFLGVLVLVAEELQE